MPTLEKEVQAPPHAVDQPGFKRFMHEWEDKLHHQIEPEKEMPGEKRTRPEHKRAA